MAKAGKIKKTASEVAEKHSAVPAEKPHPYTIFVAHDIGEDTESDGYVWLGDVLREQGHRVIVPKFPTQRSSRGRCEKQNYPEWLAVAEQALHGADPTWTILAGIGLGGVTALRIAAKVGAKRDPYAGAVVIDPLTPLDHPECLPEANSFFEDFEKKHIPQGADFITLIVHAEDLVGEPTRIFDAYAGVFGRVDKFIVVPKGLADRKFQKLFEEIVYVIEHPKAPEDDYIADSMIRGLKEKFKPFEPSMN